MQRHTSMACSRRSGPIWSSARSAGWTHAPSAMASSSAGGAVATVSAGRYLTITVSLPRLPRLWNSTASAKRWMRKLPSPAPLWLASEASGSYSGAREGSQGRPSSCTVTWIPAGTRSHTTSKLPRLVAAERAVDHVGGRLFHDQVEAAELLGREPRLARVLAHERLHHGQERE